MSKFEEVTTGFTNLMLGKEQELADSRSKICNDCTISNNGFCSKDLCIEGKGCGCGCLLSAKQRSPNSKCPIGLW